MEDYAVISVDTPLISNLSMVENIALIKEVKEGYSRKKAESLALEYLQRIGLTKIATLRVSSCSINELFDVMFIRAMMTKEHSIVIVSPLVIVKNPREIKTLFEHIDKLKGEKKVLILDTIANKNLYEGLVCNITR